MGFVTGDGNPIDVWGQSDFAGNFAVAMREAATCGAYDAVTVLLDGSDHQAVDYQGQDDLLDPVLIEAHAEASLPFYLMSTRHGVHKARQVRRLLDEGIATLGGMAQGLGAITRLAWWHRAARRRPVPVPLVSAEPGWAARAAVHEIDAKRLLAGAGLPVTESLVVADADEAVEAARSLGHPVAMKAFGDRLPHRSEHGLVALGLGDDAAVRTAFGRFRKRLGDLEADGAAIAVQEMAAPGVEVIAGVARDPDFGLMLATGPGGVLAELVDEVCDVPSSGDRRRARGARRGPAAQAHARRLARLGAGGPAGPGPRARGAVRLRRGP